MLNTNTNTNTTYTATIEVEEWRRLDSLIPELAGYEISSLGRLKSFKQNKVTGRILRPSLVGPMDIKKRYLSFPVTYKDEFGEKHEKLFYIHHLVAIAFLDFSGFPEGEKIIIHHKSGNRLSNEASNLMICTPRQHKQLHKSLGMLNPVNS